MANPNDQARQLAAADAAASVPTLASINQQYGQSMHDVGGFTRALVQLLRGSPAVGAGYTTAEKAQQAINAAAAARLAALGSPYAKGSAAAVAGMGDSSLGALLQRGAAATAYGNKMPAVATARGALAQQSLLSAKQQAIQQRNQAYGQNFMQALQAARSFGLQNRQLAQQAAQFTATQRQQMAQFRADQAYRSASLAETQREFNLTHSPGYLRFVNGLQNANATTGTTPSGAAPIYQRYGLTANEWQGKQAAVADAFTNATKSGVPINRAISEAITRGYPPPMAVWVATRVYNSLQGVNRTQHPYQFKAWQSYVSWVNQRQYAQWRRVTSATRHGGYARNPRGGKPVPFQP